MKQFHKKVVSLLSGIVAVTLLFPGAAFGAATTEAKSIITSGTPWRYVDDNSDPFPETMLGQLGLDDYQYGWALPTKPYSVKALPGVDIGVDDSDWLEANGPFGFSDGQAPADWGSFTALNGAAKDTGDRVATYFFRHNFDLDDAAAIKSVSYQFQYDDAAILYLNGTEIARYNTPSTGYTANMQYGSLVETGDFAVAEAKISIPANLLRDGENTVAVELHQDSAASDDIYLNFINFELSAQEIPPAETWRMIGKEIFTGENASRGSQGVTTDGTYWYFSSTNALEVTDMQYNRVRYANPAIPSELFNPSDFAPRGLNHIGDIDYADGKLYISLDTSSRDPVSNISYNTPVFAIYNADNFSFEKPAYPLNPPHGVRDIASWVAVDKEKNLGYGMAYNGAMEIAVYNLSDWSFNRYIPLSQPIDSAQGGKAHGDWMYFACNDTAKNVLRANLITGEVQKLFTLSIPEEQEIEGLSFLETPEGLTLNILNREPDPNDPEKGATAFYHFLLIEQPEINVSTNKAIVDEGDYFDVNVSFTEEISSNAAILTYAYDSEKVDFRGFTPADGIQELSRTVEDGILKLTVMSADYHTKEYGTVRFSAKEDIDLEKGESSIDVAARYVLKDDNGAKTECVAQGSTSFVTVVLPGDDNDNGIVDLIDLSNIISMFGFDQTTPGWLAKYRYYDFNNSGDIDIQDIVKVAQMLGQKRNFTD